MRRVAAGAICDTRENSWDVSHLLGVGGGWGSLWNRVVSASTGG